MKNRVFTSIIIFTLGILLMKNVYAISSINTALKSSANEKQKGETVKITLKLDDYEDITTGINSYKATLEYDENIFDEVSLSDFVGLNGWGEIYYNKDTKEFITIKRVGSKQPEEIIQINLTVKEEATLGQTTIGVKDIVCSEGKTDIAVNDAEIKIEIIKAESNNTNGSDVLATLGATVNSNNQNNSDNSSNPNSSNDSNNFSDNNSNNLENQNNLNNPDNSINPDNSNDSNNQNNPDSSIDSNNPNNSDNLYTSNNLENSSQLIGSNNNITNNKNTTIYQKTIPKTVNNYIILFCLIGIEIAFAIFAYIKYKKINEEKLNGDTINADAKVFVTILCAVIITTQLFGTTYNVFAAFNLKGELNGDDDINYSDVDLLEEHLIHLKNIEEDKLENADMKSDGYLSIADLSLLVQKIENPDENVIEKLFNANDIEDEVVDEQSIVSKEDDVEENVVVEELVKESNTDEVHITNTSEFIQKIKENPNGYYVLDNDIDFSELISTDVIIPETFSGILDGNGHNLTGNTSPIFNNIKNANICNLQVLGSIISSTTDDIGALAKQVSNSKLENIIGSNIEVSSTGKEIGGLIGIISDTELTNIHVTEANVYGNNRVGCLAGYVNNITIENSSSNGTVTATGDEETTEI